MSDTENAKRAKRATILNHETNAVEIEGVTFPFGQLPEKARAHFALKGYSAYLLTKDDMQAAHADAVKGDLRALTGKAEAKLDPWVEAAANVHAEQAARDAGVKPLPGKGIRATPEFIQHRAAALKSADAWTRDQRLQAKKHPPVVAEHAKLTGANTSLGSLFAPAATPAAPVAAETEAEAA